MQLTMKLESQPRLHMSNINQLRQSTQIIMQKQLDHNILRPPQFTLMVLDSIP
jgi:hypothetical protein